MNIGKSGQGECDLLEIDLAGFTRGGDELDAAGEKFGRAALVGLDVRPLVTKASAAGRSTSDIVEDKPAIRVQPRLVGKRSPPVRSYIQNRRRLAPSPSIADM